jgi:hypothetical protein
VPNDSLRKTLFRERAEQHQATQQRTKAAIREMGVFLVVIGILATLIFLFLPYLVLLLAPVNPGLVAVFITTVQAAPVVLRLLQVLGLTVAGFGVAKLVQARRAQVRSLKCPKCSLPFEVVVKTRKAMCPSCGALAILGPSTNDNLQLVECPYCHLSTAASPDAETFRCSNCGLSRPGASQKATLDEYAPCPSCKAQVPKGAIVCVQCGNAAEDAYAKGKFLPGYDMDWLIGKDGTGHGWFAGSLLKTIHASASTASRLDEIGPLFADLETSMMSVEQAGVEGHDEASMARLTAYLTNVYRDLLRKELSVIEEQPNDAYDKESIAPVVKQPYLKAVERLKGRRLLPSQTSTSTTLSLRSDP